MSTTRLITVVATTVTAAVVSVSPAVAGAASKGPVSLVDCPTWACGSNHNEVMASSLNR